jgi:hypothetical protein
MLIVSDVTVRNVDRLVLFSTVRFWISSFLLAGGIGLLAFDFFQYTVDISLAPHLYGGVVVAYLLLASGIGGFKDSLPLSASAAVGLVAFSVFGTDLLKVINLTALVFADILAVVLVIAVVLYRVEMAHTSGPYRQAATSVPAYPDDASAPGTMTRDVFRAKLATLGALAGFVAAVVVMMTTDDWQIQMFGGVGTLMLLAVVRSFMLRSKRLQALVAKELATLDLRKPVILLRSFYDDYIVAGITGLKFEEFTEAIHWEKPPLLQKVTSMLAHRGPVVAVGMPGEQEAPLGAARAYVRDEDKNWLTTVRQEMHPLGAARAHASDEDWLKVVRQKMQDANLIVLIAGQSPGLALELDAIQQEDGFLKKAVCIVPCVSPRGSDSEETRGSFVPSITQEVSVPDDVRGDQCAAERARFVLRTLGISWKELGVIPANVRAFYFNGHALVVIESESEAATSVLHALEVVLTHVPESARQEERPHSAVAVAPVWRRLWPFQLHPFPLPLGLVAGVVALLGLPLLLLANFPIVGRFTSTQLQDLEAFTTLNGSFVLAVALLYSWLLRLNGRYGTGRDSTREIFERVAGSALPTFVVLVVVLLATVILGKDSSELIVPRPGGGVFPVIAGLVLLASAPWGLWRLLASLKRLWATTLADVALNTGLSLAACAVLCFGGWLTFASYVEEGASTSDKPTSSRAELLLTVANWHRYVKGVGLAAQLPESSRTEVCRALKFFENDKAFVWKDSVPKWGIVMGGERYRVIFCVPKPVPLSVLLLAEIRSREKMHMTSNAH